MQVYNDLHLSCNGLVKNLVLFVSLGMILLNESEIRAGAGGGKAKGLLALREFGVRVPEFVALRIDREQPDLGLEAEVPPWFSPFQGKLLAVRSSGRLEDGGQASFAGQYESKLNVSGDWAAVRKAMTACLEANENERVKAYQEKNQLSDSEKWFGLVIQEMVSPSYAGVLFTVDPLHPFRDRCVCSMVAGLGEGLVSGKENAWNFTWLHATGPLIPPDALPAEFPPVALKTMDKEAQKLHSLFGYPIDLEWALDADYQLFWLQARPVTRLSEVHATSLNCTTFRENDWFTLGNVGEMMPGAVSPMTQELFGGAVDAGLKDFARHSGVPSSVTGGESMRYIQIFYNRLFFNLSNLYDFCKYTGLNEKANIDLSIVGRLTEAPGPVAEVGYFMRGTNFLRQVRYLNSAGGALRKLNRMVQEFQREWPEEVEELYRQLKAAQLKLDIAFGYHFATSSQSGSYYAALVRVISKNQPPDALHHGAASSLLSQLGEVESVDPLKQLHELAEKMAALCTAGVLEIGDHPEMHAESFGMWERFLAVHGHRGFREAEFSTPGWGDDPDSLLPVLHQMVKQALRNESKPVTRDNAAPAAFPGKKPPGILISLARKAVVRREQSKSACIAILNRMKQGYRKLGNLLYERGDLKYPEQVFYLLQAELAALCKQGSISTDSEFYSKLAEQRKEAVLACADLQFEEVCKGAPLPMLLPPAPAADGEIRGIPVSRGRIEARVCLVNSLEEADRLQPGQIMVTRITDIAWTPWFSIASGIVTEIGSPLSHGAVVAREYGLPAVVSVPGVMQRLRDGELVTLDGGSGEIIPLER